MKILITGHKGFIGSHLFKTLAVKHDLTGFDIGDPFPNGKYDVVVHLAARGLIRKSVEKPFEYFEDDLAMTMKFLEMTRKNDGILFFPSSGSAAIPSNPYSLSKKQSVEWINLYRKLYSLRAYDMTFYNIYGSGSRKGGVYLFSKMALSGGPITLLGNGKDIRDFVYVTDVVNFIASAIDGAFNPGSYEIGTGVGTSITQLAEMISEEAGGHLQINMEPDVIQTAPRLVARSPALSSFIPLSEGIKLVMKFIREED